MNKVNIAAALIGGSILLLSAQPLVANTIAGHYRCEGIDSRTQEKYTGDTVFTATDAPGVYESKGNTSDSDYVFYSRGVVDGDVFYQYWHGIDIRNGMIAENGVAYYKITKDGKLIGYWLTTDADAPGSEECTLIK